MRAAPNLPWPRLGNSGDPQLVNLEDLMAAQHFLWVGADYLWITAGAVRGQRRDASLDWDAEDIRLVERVGDCPPWESLVNYNPGWKGQPDAGLSMLAFIVSRAIRALPEVTVIHLKGIGLSVPIDARRASMRAAARDLGWRPVTLRRFLTRDLPFHPLTAIEVLDWLRSTASLPELWTTLR